MSDYWNGAWAAFWGNAWDANVDTSSVLDVGSFTLSFPEVASGQDIHFSVEPGVFHLGGGQLTVAGRGRAIAGGGISGGGIGGSEIS